MPWSYFTWYLSLEDIDSALVVMYEDLKENTVKEVKRMLEFLKQPCNNTILEELVKKDYTTFLRSKPEQHIEYYPLSYLPYIRCAKGNTLGLVSHVQEIRKENTRGFYTFVVPLVPFVHSRTLLVPIFCSRRLYPLPKPS